MENTYWNHKGTYSELNSKLEKLIPISGSVDRPYKNKALERFRKASNAYYDIFNNGGCNRGAAIAKTFGPDVNERLRSLHRNWKWCDHQRYWNAIHKMTEPKMDEFILAAAKEQGFI